MPPLSTAFTTAIKTAIAVACGGASGAILPLLQRVMGDGDFNHMDWHQVGQSAMYGAMVAVISYYIPPPQKKQ